MVGAEVTGLSRHLHHDAVSGGGGAPWARASLFLVGWLIMVAAMMLPASLSAFRRVRSSTGDASPAVLWGFLGGFTLVWGVAGYALLGFDLVLHRIVDTVPALSARPWLVASALLGAAGAVQLAPSAQRRLAAARGRETIADTPRAAITTGRKHAASCLRADGALLLVMFAAGGRLGWMVVLTALMAAERSTPIGRHVVGATGLIFVFGAALLVLSPTWVPAPFGSLA
jgi:predicted metal-binding membrane protein